MRRVWLPIWPRNCVSFCCHSRVRLQGACIEGTRAPASYGCFSATASLHRNLKLHLLRTDLEESLGTRESCCAAYDRILELRIATPQVGRGWSWVGQVPTGRRECGHD